MKRFSAVLCCLAVGLLMILPLVRTAFAGPAWTHASPPYSVYAGNQITISGDGVAGSKTFSLQALEAMAEGQVEALYTMRTLVEPHNGKYRGIALGYLLKNQVGLKESAKKVKVVCQDGVSLEFSLEEIFKTDYVNEVDNTKLKMILAYGKDGYPLVPDSTSKGFSADAGNDGGPLRLMVGQTAKGEHNSPKCLQNVTGIVVSCTEKKETFTDVGRFYSWAREAIDTLAEKEIINGVAPGKFAPDQSLTRAQFAAIMTRALGIQPEGTYKGKFADVKKGAWYAPYVELAAQKGLINGYEDGTFRPDQPVTRQEMVVLAVRAMGLGEEAKMQNGSKLTYRDKDKIPAWVKGSAEIAEEKGLLENIAVGYFAGAKVSDRAEAAVVVYRMMEKMQ